MGVRGRFLPALVIVYLFVPTRATSKEPLIICWSVPVCESTGCGCTRGRGGRLHRTGRRRSGRRR
eukprot:6198499-Lingulodinium_polyedra.AAC.1